MKKELEDMPKGQVRVIAKKVYGCGTRTESVYAFDRTAAMEFLTAFVLKNQKDGDVRAL